MARTKLSRHLGDGGALFDSAAGQDNLNKIMKDSLANDGKALTAFVVGTVATATIFSYLVGKPTCLRDFRAAIAVAGSAGSTVVKATVNGTDVPGATITIDNAEADGTKKSADFTPFDLKANDLLQFVVSTAPTGGSGLTVSADLSAVDVA